jgi:hypothetical protein
MSPAYTKRSVCKMWGVLFCPLAFLSKTKKQTHKKEKMAFKKRNFEQAKANSPFKPLLIGGQKDGG